MTKDWLTYPIKPEEEGRKIESIMRHSLGLSRRMRQKAARNDAFTLNEKKAYLGTRVSAGDVLKILLHLEEEGHLAPVEMALDIAFEDKDVILLNKPSGIEVHPPEQRSAFRPTLAHGVAYYFEKIGLKAKVRPLHRLDKDTSGLVLFTKSAYAHHALDQQLQEGKVKRSYQTILLGTPPAEAGTIELAIGRDPRHPLRRKVSEEGERAVTHYKVLQVLSKDLSLVEVHLETGRTHQIRVHFSHLGIPVLGDSLYGGQSMRLNRQALHAKALRWLQPRTKEPIEVQIDLPEDMQALLPPPL
ncbi:RluA family pseudouridine synthase [Heliorestis acidaminivorans]|uniref:RluA family pseudouridine synthase n=1 Tax=Heliorestis acidaminivorans TaxID=553427 RepID=UPI001478B4E6|nr:RluA family pseudouridine synthase [Heliorestis acidaminivorans]